MGLKRTYYQIPNLGITIPTAYAKINNLSIDKNGTASAQFYIQQSREEMDLVPFEVIPFVEQIDKNQPAHEQIYNAAKETIFTGWEDDIVD